MREGVKSALEDWIPYKLFEENGQAGCRWLYLGDQPFTAPFFTDTISRCLQLPENSRAIRSASSLDILPDWSQQVETVSPALIIFHVSRCGSTLLSQLLSLQPANIVLSEVPFFDELLRQSFMKKQLPAAVPLLKAALSFYGARRNENNRRLIIKADSWHIHFYKEYRELFPQTPFILLYRKPAEVIRSQQKRRGMQSVPGVLEPELFGFEAVDIQKLNLDEYMAKVLETYFSAFADILQSDPLAFPVSYHEGTGNIINRMVAVSGITISTDEKDAMIQRSTFHAKYPDEVFREDQPDELEPGYLQKVSGLYEKLEKTRIAPLSSAGLD